jgi:hypothetical protein
MNRKKPIERDFKATDSSKTSILTPSWMQIPIAEGSKAPADPLKAATFGILRKDQNRTFLAEKD